MHRLEGDRVEVSARRIRRGESEPREGRPLELGRDEPREVRARAERFVRRRRRTPGLDPAGVALAVEDEEGRR